MAMNWKSGSVFFAAVILSHVATATCVSAQNFSYTGSLNTARYNQTATLLTNGIVLIAGGTNSGFAAEVSAELYDPATGTFTTTGSLNAARTQYSATLLNNGKVLIAGGNNGLGVGLASAELYDPATGTFTFTGSLNTARQNHTATLLNNGMVLIAGGLMTSEEITLASAELYDPATGTFTFTGSLNTARFEHTATLLNNGMVLFAGGVSYASSSVLASAELYNPATGIFTTTGSLNTARTLHTATLLNNGMVLFAGGSDSSGNASASAELYNPATGIFTPIESLDTARFWHTATPLNNGMVLIAGGADSGGNALASAELCNPATETFALTGTLNTARSLHTATLLNNGMVLIAGGATSGLAAALGTAELYEPSMVSPPPTSETIPQPLNPTAPTQFQFDNNVHNFSVQYPAGTSFSGVNMTVTAVQTPQASFQERVAGTSFANALCIVYSGENGYCEDYQVSCTDTNMNPIACPSESTPTISVKTSYDTEQAIINPGFLTTPIGTNEWTNIFDSFYLQRIDPTTRGRTTGFSEFIAVSLGTSNSQGAAQFNLLGPLEDDVRIFPVGTLIPVEFQLTSIAQPGQPVTDAAAGITVTMLSGANGNPISSIVLENSSAFRYERGKYVYYLDTRGYAPGTYNVTVYGNAFAAYQVQFTLPVSTTGAQLRTQLQSLTFDRSTYQYVATLTVTNTGTAEANGVIVFASALNFAFTSTPMPVSLGDIGPASSATATLTYPAWAVRPGDRAFLIVLEDFAGGHGDGFFLVNLPERPEESEK